VYDGYFLNWRSRKDGVADCGVDLIEVFRAWDVRAVFVTISCEPFEVIDVPHSPLHGSVVGTARIDVDKE
jgi:hypothetical protein